ncbi:MAG: T9SS type A sorting domain-containing protein [Salibacteraceae bacterium]
MKKLLLIIMVLFTQSLVSQVNRKVLLLDLTAINSETNNSRFFSVEYILNNIKVPYEVTTSFDNLSNYPVVIAASRIKESTLTLTQVVQLNDYVNNGGVLITSSLREPNLFNTFGISSSNSSNTNFELIFDTNADPEIFEYINEDLEKTISLGRASKGTTFYSREYEETTGDIYGMYENNQVAFIHNSYGTGHTYLLGPDFRDVVYRNLLGLDVSAHRTYSNGFEPTTDVIFMIIRNVIRKHIPNTIYPHTVPSDAKSVVLVTHDIDNKTAYDTMSVFSQYEMDMGFAAQYNATAKYFVSSWSSYYPSAVTSLQNVFDQGHKVSSHSVGHFPDFADFDLGNMGNNEANYMPVNTAGSTVGGSVLGELEFSADLLAINPNINIRTFRAGHLAYPDSLALGLQMVDYDFNSTHSSNDILTNFPYEQMEIRKFTTDKSSVLEIPMTISDVFHSDPINSGNYLQKVEIWGEVTEKYADNHSPVNLLIHPNRNYKLSAQIQYINELPSGVIPYNFEDYGDFWRARQSLEYTTELNGNEVDVNISSSLDGEISFLMDVSPGMNVNFFDLNNQPIAMQSKTWNSTQTLFYQNSLVGIENKEITHKELLVYPNPTNNMVTINLENIRGQPFQLGIYNVQGQKVFEANYEAQNLVNVSLKEYPNGIYIYVVQTHSSSFNGRLIKQ